MSLEQEEIMSMIRKLVENDMQNGIIIENLAALIKDLLVRVRRLEENAAL